ncbi:undecaprenyl-diphosphate phosphatase [Actinacidiphila acidipaludis]|uniref:Undecaprenyl-diphosphatase n=1 Tax=Actinacidiphila acidipaludis TaxID=2873382 RepID=A0ABS7QAM9_9ACTN|nr:undecaprenyl-diphosphate phosphatase [Streptomyces acidipaludis]MBY8879916.1 undecaprenyl-diphosphate phosphatase [Streptomyces acidipaludis]
MSDLSYLQAVTIGALQGVTELFPVSSLGHSVLVPAWIGGSWQHLVTENASGDSGASPYLAFVVALHVATALALVVYFRKDWVAVVGALFTTLRTRRVNTSTERLAWLLVVGTIPVGITGLALEHTFRTLFAKPEAAAAFLTVNGVILYAGERLRRGAEVRAAAAEPELSAGPGAATEGDIQARAPKRRLDTLDYREAGVIGLFQTLALLAGISRSGITMVGGLLRGLDHEDAAKFSFLLATPVILAAGLLKLPSLAGSAGDHIHGQVAVGFLTAGVCAYASVRFLSRWFTTRTLTPFAIYCLVAGAGSMIWFA